MNGDDEYFSNTDSLLKSLMGFNKPTGYQGGVPYRIGYTPSSVTPSSDFWSWDGFWGNSETGQQGWGMPAMNALTSGLNLGLGFKKMGLANDMFKQDKREWRNNFNEQAKARNYNLEQEILAANSALEPGRQRNKDAEMAQWGSSYV